MKKKPSLPRADELDEAPRQTEADFDRAVWRVWMRPVAWGKNAPASLRVISRKTKDGVTTITVANPFAAPTAKKRA